ILRAGAVHGDGRGAAGHQLGLVDAGSAPLVLRSLFGLLVLLDGGRVGRLRGGVLSGRLSPEGGGGDGLLLLGGQRAVGQGQAGQGGDWGETGDGLVHGSLLFVYDRSGRRGCQRLEPWWLPLTLCKLP